MTAFVATHSSIYAGNAGSVTGAAIIPDGYINTVEKVWIDSFTFSAVLTTADTIQIATVPANKKITSVEVYIPTNFAPTTATINVGTSGEATKFINSVFPISESSAAGAYLVDGVARMNEGFAYVTTASTNILLSLGVVAATAPTAGTIKTIVRWT